MRAARAYGDVARHTSVMTGDSVDLILLLYDKLLQRLQEARFAFEAEDVAARGEATGKAIDIIDTGLLGSIDLARGGEVALRLKAHYQSWSMWVLRYNISPDQQLLSAVETQVRSLREAWVELKQQFPSDPRAGRLPGR